MRRLKIGRPIAGKIAVAEVVDDDEEKVRRPFLLGEGSAGIHDSPGEESQENKDGQREGARGHGDWGKVSPLHRGIGNLPYGGEVRM